MRFTSLQRAQITALVLTTGASLSPATSWAGGKGLFPNARVHLGLSTSIFSGPQGSSFAGNSQAFGLEFSAERSAEMLAIVGKVRGDYATGSIDFMDGGTSRTLSFLHYAVDFNLGLKFFPIPTGRAKFPVRPYFSGTGDVGIAALKFSNSVNLTSLESSYSAPSFGYTFAAGVSAGPSSYQAGGVSFFVELALRRARANLAGNSAFGLNNIRVTGGIGW